MIIKSKKRVKVKWLVIITSGIMFIAVLIIAAVVLQEERIVYENPKELLIKYMDYLSKNNYEEMYQMLDLQKSGNITKDDFIERNKKIYEGIEMQNIRIEEVNTLESQRGNIFVTYITTFDTVAGEIQFENKAEFAKGKTGYLIVWKDNIIFPNLNRSDKVRVLIHEAGRGKILDRNGKVLAGEGTASSVGVVPEKLEDMDTSLERIAVLLEMDLESVKKKINAKWVKKDSFVPLKTLQKVKETDLMEISPSQEVLKEKERQNQLLSISGVMITDIAIREYPLKEAASHLVGYIQKVTAEDLEEHKGEGYNTNSVIGRSGMEGLYEKELKVQR